MHDSRPVVAGDTVRDVMNQNASDGVLYKYRNEYIIRGVISTNDVDALSKAVLKRVGEVPLLLGDVADVHIGAKMPKLGVASHRAKPAVLLTVTKQPHTSTLDLTRKLDASIVELQKTMPRDVQGGQDAAGGRGSALRNLILAFWEDRC